MSTLGGHNFGQGWPIRKRVTWIVSIRRDLQFDISLGGAWAKAAKLKFLARTLWELYPAHGGSKFKSENEVCRIFSIPSKWYVTRRVLGEIEKICLFWYRLWPPISRARVKISVWTWAIIFYFLRAFEWRITYGGNPLGTIWYWVWTNYNSIRE